MTPAPRLDDLVTEVEHDASDETPLARLSTAATMSSEMTATADAVVGHFVERARLAGHSWSEIGDALGVSKQAAQQRHVARVATILDIGFSRFTDRARQTVAHSQTVARELGHTYVGTEHLLVAQFSAVGGISARIMSEAGMSEAALTEAIVARFGRGAKPPAGVIPFTPRTVAALQDALAVAVEMGHNYIGTEHLLLGLSRVEGSAAAELLAEAGLGEPAIRAQVVELLA